MKIFYYKKIIIIILLFFLIFEKKKNNAPKISVFLPIYNMGKYLKRAILNIQNQTLKNIEIIAVNDCSNDNTLEILKGFAERDNRIKIINNKKNRGLLYSRAMGILHSSGQYLMNFDADDEFANSDDLEYLYNKAIASNADIISYEFLLQKPTINFINPCDKFDVIIKQPKLFDSIYSTNYILKDFLIWNKLIKKTIYLKSFSFFEKYIYSDKKWNYHEDNIWSILVNKFAHSKLCVNKIIYKYNNNYNNNSLSNKRQNFIEFNNIIYRFDMIRNIFKSKLNYNYMKSECSLNANNIYFNNNFRNYIASNSELKIIIIYNLYNCLNNNYRIEKENKKYIVNLLFFFVDNIKKIK